MDNENHDSLPAASAGALRKMLLLALGALLLISPASPVEAAQPAQAPATIKAQAARPSTLLAADTAGRLWSYSTPGNTRLGARTLVSDGWRSTKQIISADWNSDGSPDIIARRGDGSLTLQTGLGNGQYRLASILGNGWQNYDILITKLHRSDSYPGVVARNTKDGTLFYYPNRFGGSLGSPRTLIGAGWAPMTELNAVDLDMDGGMDILARSSTGKIILYRTNGIGGFVKESRKTVGAGWASKASISTVTGFAGTGTVGLIARSMQGQLHYYPLAGGRIGSGKPIADHWNGYQIAEGSTASAAKSALRGAYQTAYASQVYNYVKKWCPKARVVLNHPSVVSGDIYGMMWWGANDLAIRTDIPAAVTKSIALHECGHMLQAKVYGWAGKSTASARMRTIYGGTGTWGLEENADCIAAYLSPYAQPSSVGAASEASHWASSCRGYKGEAAKAIIGGRRP